MTDTSKVIRHRDGTYTYWDVYDQVWRRNVSIDALTDKALASMPQRARDRIIEQREFAGSRDAELHTED